MAAAQQDIHAAHFGLEDFSDFSDGMPVLDEDDEEELANSYPSVAVILGSSHDLGTGTLFITTRCSVSPQGFHKGGMSKDAAYRAPYTTGYNAASTCRRVIWQGDAGSRRGLYADFQNINMHAISSDQSAARKPCIYMQLEPSTSAFADTAEGEADDDEDITPEVRLVPEDSSKCES